MENIIFPDASPRERKQLLEDNCDSKEKKTYSREFTPQRLEAMKDDLSQTVIKISDLETEKKAVVDEFKGKLKPLKEDQTRLTENIKRRAEYVTEDCYKMIDHEASMVGFYNAEGKLIESRPIRPEEKQTTIFTRSLGSNEKTGTYN